MPNAEILTEPVPPVIPSGDEIYQYIMAKIEPELLPQNLDGLKEKYKDETPEQSKARGERYDKAFAEYDVQYAAAMEVLEGKVRAYQHQAVASVEQEDRTTEANEMADLEKSISSI